MSKRTHDDDGGDDDDDYMSDKILAVAARTVAPQLLNIRRRAPPPPPPVPSEKSRRVIEIEQRDQGLSTALTSDNKGYQLLKKMGYKDGSKLGANSTHGLTEPLPILMHPSRSGLGEEREKKERIRVKHEVKAKFTEQIQSSYQDNLKQKYYDKRLRSDIRKCQITCEKLDREKFQLEENPLWKNHGDDDDEKEPDEEDDDRPLNTEAQLNMLTCYLRDKHLYCIWCGQTFDTSDELENTCPGNDRDLH